MNKKGQALMEFILILPVLILILFCMIDFGKIYYYKITLNSELDNVISMYNDNKSLSEIKKTIKSQEDGIKIDVLEEDKYTKYSIQKNIEIITPGLSNVLGKNYLIEEYRIINYE